MSPGISRSRFPTTGPAAAHTWRFASTKEPTSESSSLQPLGRAILNTVGRFFWYNGSMITARRTTIGLYLLIAACGLAPAEQALAQIKAAPENPYLRFGETQVGKYRVGATVTARKGPVQKLQAMVAIPFTCAEQDVELVEEDITPQVQNVDYRELSMFAEGGAHQMLITIPYLAGGEEARAIVTFKVHTRTILPPEDTSSLRIPAKPNRELKRFLGKSPFIETKHPKIKKALREIDASLAKKTGEESESSEEEATITEEITQEVNENTITAWQRVEAIYDFVQDHVNYVEGPDKSALKTLADASGDCQNISALFVALCRTAGVPARIVWVHEHNYAEFCLVDPEGEPHWFPCESAGARAFGEMPLARVILQKGDNFKVPERPRDALRYASDYLIGLPVPGSGKPRVKYIRDQL